MTVNLDIPALADEMKAMAAFYMERPCVPTGFPLALTDMSDRERKAVASLLLRATAALTTALEIGRAMGMSQAAEICEEAAERCRTNEREQYGRGNGGGADIWAIRAVASEQRAAAIRSTAHAVDLEGLTERIARAWWETDSHDEEWDRGAWDSIPEDSREIVRKHARAVLSSLGLHAREN